MLFVMLFGLWCSQFAALRELAAKDGFERPRGTTVASVTFTWIVFSLFYYRQRLLVMFVVQCVIPATNGLVAVIGIVMVGPVRDLFTPFLGLAVLANLAWFPVAVLVMTARWWRRPLATEFTETHDEEPVSDDLPGEPGDTACRDRTEKKNP